MFIYRFGLRRTINIVSAKVTLALTVPPPDKAIISIITIPIVAGVLAPPAEGLPLPRRRSNAGVASLIGGLDRVAIWMKHRDA